MQRLLIYLAFFVLISSISLLSGGLWSYWEFKKSGPLSHDMTVLIKRGMSANSISTMLEELQIINNSLVFKIGLGLFAEAKPLRAGEYLVPAKASTFQLIQILQVGKTFLRPITFAEGLTSSEVVRLILNTEELTGIVDQVPDEGTLLPETYYFSYGDSREALLNRMKRSMSQLANRMWLERSNGLPLKSIKEAIILASIVEKETGKNGERPHVAAVFINRLRLKMRLQSDPTVIYGITLGEKPLGRRLTRLDLKHTSPFNTYIIRGLPPAPIANPGQKAIQAVLHPKTSDDLYFVADGTGGHAFSKTLKEHEQNRARWRIIREQLK